MHLPAPVPQNTAQQSAMVATPASVTSSLGGAAVTKPRNKRKPKEGNHGPSMTREPLNNERTNTKPTRTTAGMASPHPYQSSRPARDARVHQVSDNTAPPNHLAMPSNFTPHAGPSRLVSQPAYTTRVAPMMVAAAQGAPIATPSHYTSGFANRPATNITDATQTSIQNQLPRSANTTQSAQQTGYASVGQPAGCIAQGGAPLPVPETDMYTGPDVSDNAALFGQYAAAYPDTVADWAASARYGLVPQQAVNPHYAPSQIPNNALVGQTPNFVQGQLPPSVGPASSVAQSWDYTSSAFDLGLGPMAAGSTTQGLYDPAASAMPEQGAVSGSPFAHGGPVPGIDFGQL
jgi:hypothetical protein